MGYNKRGVGSNQYQDKAATYSAKREEKERKRLSVGRELSRKFGSDSSRPLDPEALAFREARESISRSLQDLVSERTARNTREIDQEIAETIAPYSQKIYETYPNTIGSTAVYAIFEQQKPDRSDEQYEHYARVLDYASGEAEVSPEDLAESTFFIAKEKDGTWAQTGDVGKKRHLLTAYSLAYERSSKDPHKAEEIRSRMIELRGEIASSTIEGLGL